MACYGHAVQALVLLSNQIIALSTERVSLPLPTFLLLNKRQQGVSVRSLTAAAAAETNL